MKKSDTNPCLYILARSDLASMNPGKLAAQCSHASNSMVHKMRKSGNAKMQNLLHKWENSTKQGFGTCLVLDCHNEISMVEVLRELSKGKCEVLSDIINDPTYPIRDLEITHYISLNTCAYIFCDKNDEKISSILEKFSLYK